MALYRLEAKIIGRKYPAKERGKNRGREIKKTRSVVAASAYRSGGNLLDERTGVRHDYRNRSKDIIYHAILSPDGAPDWVRDSGQLWNRAEAAEKRKDAQLAREFILAVPPELTPEQQFQLAADWVKKDLVGLGMIAEVALHHPKTGTNPLGIDPNGAPMESFDTTAKIVSLPPGTEPSEVRTLKIEAHGAFWKGLIKPKIRLTGKWLERAGFTPGHRVQVKCVSPGIIELRCDDFQKVEALLQGRLS